MKKLTLIVALAFAAAFAWTPNASAQTAQFVFTPISSTNVAPGQNITFSINLVFATGGTMNNIQGLAYWLQQNGASPYVFSLVSPGRDLTGSSFNDPNTASLTLPQALNPSNSQDLGATRSSGLGSSTYFISNITLQVAPTAALGSYTISSTSSGLKTSRISNSNGDTFSISPASLQVQVVPEPSTVGLMIAGVVGLAAFRRRIRK